MNASRFMTNSTYAFVIAAAVFSVSNRAFAKPVAGVKHAIVLPRTGSLTPPPKEWAMFPQDEPQPQQGQAPHQGNPNAANGGAGSASSESSGNFVSAANAHSVPAKSLPLFWIFVTGVLSLGAVAACGSLIMRSDAAQQAQTLGSGTVPVVSDAQEIRA
jgi:hypothetical protein